MEQMNNKGFSMVEAIIMIAVLSTVMVMAFPNFIEFFKLQEEVSEERTMNEIREALSLYADANKKLPEEATWVADIAPFTSLTENAIANDVWGSPRYYKRELEQLSYRSSGNIDAYYAVVYGYGPDRISSNAVDNNDGAMNWAGFFDSANDPDSDKDYANLETLDDDFMVKVTNYPAQVRNYEETEKRLQAISDALANYAIAKFNAAQALNPGDPGYEANSEQFNYYPQGDVQDTLEPDNVDYHPAVINDYTYSHPDESPSVRNRGVSEGERRDDMETLMRVLGLPLSYCCSALAIDEDTGEEPAFYYYSNPRPLLNGGGCGNRPGPGKTRLPPRLAVEVDDCG